jgi:hypothetical protein
MKKKANGYCLARISHSTASPVVGELNIKILLKLLTLANWKSQLIDVKGVFLKERLSHGENL